MAELADAHGSGPCDSNIMRVQVPSSARRLKSKDLSLFLVSHQQSRDAAAPKGPRASSGFRQHFFSLHSLPFPLPPHSRQHTAPVKLRAQTAWVEGAGFLLARRKMRWRPGDTYLSNASCELCPRTSALSIFLGA